MAFSFARASVCVAGLVALCVACGGSDFSSAQGAGNEAGAEGGAAMGDSGVGDDAAMEAGSSGAVSDAQGDGSSGSSDASPQDGPSSDAITVLDGPTTPCPDLGGSYSIVIVDAAGCGSLNAVASECIRQVSSCSIELRSSISGGGPAAISGSTTIKASGSFDGAVLMEGNSTRSGCTGSWSPATSTLTVDCGGTDSGQSCVVALTRTSTASCN